MGRKFKPPKIDDLYQWRKVKYLFDHGFRFETVYAEHKPVRYPESLKDAEEFVKKYGQEG